MRVSFNENVFKKMTLKEVKNLYKGRTEKEQILAERFWRKLHPNKRKSKSEEEE